MAPPPVRRSFDKPGKPQRPGTTTSKAEPTADLDELKSEVEALQASVAEVNEKLDYLGPMLQALMDHLGCPDPHAEGND
jgi:hypothetical protein